MCRLMQVCKLSLHIYRFRLTVHLDARLSAIARDHICANNIHRHITASADDWDVRLFKSECVSWKQSSVISVIWSPTSDTW